MHLDRILLSVVMLTIICVASMAAEKPVVYAIPRLEQITVDGRSDDWGTRGFRVDVLHDISEALLDNPRTTLSDVTMRLGWDARGLLVLLNVVDVSPQEDNDVKSLWRKDSVELYMTDELGGKNFYQLLITPGVDGTHADIRNMFYDHRSNEALKAVPLAYSAAREKTATGYVLEVLLPWSNLGVTPAVGRTVGVQAMINDYDPQGALWHKLWYPQAGAAFFSDHMYTVRLEDSPGTPVRLQAYCYHEHFRNIVVSAIGAGDQAGKTLTVREGRRMLGHAKLTVAQNNRSKADVLIPLLPAGHQYQLLTAVVGNERFTLDPTPIYFARLKARARMQIVFSSSVFTGTGFPSGDFTDPALAENLLGRYTLRTTYYDAAYRQVYSANAPGRYGALVEVTSESGINFRRYLTLYRQPVAVKWGERGQAITQSLLGELGANAAVMQEQAPTLDDIRQRLVGGFNRLPESAVFLAGLAEMAPGDAPASDRTGVFGRDARWWYGLRKQYNIAESYPYSTLYPAGYKVRDGKRYPLIVFLHGSGGSESDFETFKKDPVPVELLTSIRDKYPCIVVAPFSLVGGWAPAIVDATVSEVLAKEPIDPDRVYLTGLSMGGYGSWRTAAWYPERYAAVVPVCGGGDVRDAGQFKHLPVWAFHGDADEAVPVAYSKDMVKAITDAGGQPKLTIYPGVGHPSWVKAYADPALFEWLFQQKRGQ